jgi:hypothetical protein
MSQLAPSPATGLSRLRLPAALAVSLLLHLASLAALAQLPGSGGGRPAPRMARVSASLHVAAPGATIAASEAVAQPEAEHAVADGTPASGELAARIAGLGERRLLLAPPPHVGQPAWSPVPEGGWYFPRSELSVTPRLLDEPSIGFPPPQGDELPLSGKVLLRVLVGATGEVDRVELVNSRLPPEYVAAAIAGFAGARFRPGEIEDVPVTSEARFVVDFDGGHGDSQSAGLRSPGRTASISVSPAGH